MNSYVRKKVTMKDRRESIRKIILGRTFRTVLSTAMFGFGILCIWQVNTVSAKGYVISDYEQKVSTLERETRSLDVAIAEHTSIQNIRERLGDNQFEVVTKPEFATLNDTSVARQ